MGYGRPTKYDDNMLAMAKNYLMNLPEDEEFPSIAGLAIYLGVARDTIREWAGQEDKKDFSAIVETLLQIQEKRLINKGAKGEFNSTITKLLLSKHGYREESATEFLNPLQVEARNSEAKALAYEYEEKLKATLSAPKPVLPAPTPAFNGIDSLPISEIPNESIPDNQV